MSKEERGMYVISQNVRIRRKAKYLRIIDLAHRAKLSKSLISSIENEYVNNISLRTLEQLAEGLDVVSLMTPISLEEYDDISDAEYVISKKEMEKIFYPPMARYGYISSMLELSIILPLIEPSRLYDIYLRIGGQTDDREYYISELFTRAWEDVPDSLEKRYVEKELQRIHEKRMGNEDFETDCDDMYFNEYKAYEQMIEKRRDFVNRLRWLLDDNPFLSSDN